MISAQKHKTKVRRKRVRKEKRLEGGIGDYSSCRIPVSINTFLLSKAFTDEFNRENPNVDGQIHGKVTD